MKVTIEGTEQHLSFPSPTVTITTATDDVSVEDALDIVKRALIAYGFQPENIYEFDVR